VIQLRSAIEELGQVRIRKEVVPPTWTSDPEVRRIMDGAARDRLLDWGTAPGKKALFIGATWPELVVELAQADMFVSVVDDDPAAVRRISEAAGAAGVLARVTAHADSYAVRQFESAGFNLIVVWDSLTRFSPWLPLLKKMVRELKTGGKLLIRAPLTTSETRPAMRQLARVALSLTPAVSRAAVSQDTFLMPDAFGLDPAELTAAVEDLLVIEQRQPQHVRAPDLADLAAHASERLQRALPRVVAADARLLESHPERARFLTLWCAKERELGRVFKQPG